MSCMDSELQLIVWTRRKWRTRPWVAARQLELPSLGVWWFMIRSQFLSFVTHHSRLRLSTPFQIHPLPYPMEANEQDQSVDGSPIFDSLDIDLVVKVLAHTAFSQACFLFASWLKPDLFLTGPFFTFFIPVFYVFQGAKLTDSVVVVSACYYVAVSVFCMLDAK